MEGRGFWAASTLQDDRLALALAPGLTPDGLDEHPSFFHGFAVHPLVVAHGLLALADLTGSRFRLRAGSSSAGRGGSSAPVDLRDPVLTAQGDRLRAEVFSSCNTVYGRFDLLQTGLDGGEVRHGTTNVDINLAMRAALGRVGRADLLHLDVGDDGLTASTPSLTATERPVTMPDRWVRALGNAALLHQPAEPVITLDRSAARTFISALPPAQGRTVRGWLEPRGTDLRLSTSAVAGGVPVDGLNRLDALRRLVLHVESLTLYRFPDQGEGTPALIEVALPGSRFTLGLTGRVDRGYSGEGTLLTDLATDTAAADSRLVSALLSFEPVLDVDELARRSALPADRVRRALAVLAAAGRVGWDAHEGSWFHRELPDDVDIAERSNPRLRDARSLVAEGAVARAGDARNWIVAGYPVVLDDDGEDRCSCAWYLRHRGDRGPCKHVLAARMTAGAAA